MSNANRLNAPHRIIVQNTGSGDVFLGEQSAVTTGTGYKLVPGDAFEVDLMAGDKLHGIASSTQTVRIMIVV